MLYSSTVVMFITCYISNGSFQFLVTSALLQLILQIWLVHCLSESLLIICFTIPRILFYHFYMMVCCLNECEILIWFFIEHTCIPTIVSTEPPHICGRWHMPRRAMLFLCLVVLYYRLKHRWPGSDTQHREKSNLKLHQHWAGSG